MDIRINGAQADITLESEKTVGEVLAGLEQWLSESDPRYSGGYRLGGLVIDGKTAGAGDLADFFDRAVDSVASLDVIILSLAELLAEALADVLAALDEFGGLDFAARQQYAGKWKETPAAALLKRQYPEIYAMALHTFSGEGAAAGELASIVTERLREQETPSLELKNMERLIFEIASRLEDLPLDVQTGKDGRAFETVQFFSGAAGKLFRIFNVLKTGGFPVAEMRVGEMPVPDYIGEFNGIIKELLSAYETRDTVLIGDLAEYELAPRLRGLFAAMNEPFTEAA